MKNVVLGAEAAIVLDLVETVEHDVRGYHEGKTKTHTLIVEKCGNY